MTKGYSSPEIGDMYYLVQTKQVRIILDEIYHESDKSIKQTRRKSLCNYTIPYKNHNLFLKFAL
jgi:hypothetical protein